MKAIMTLVAAAAVLLGAGRFLTGGGEGGAASLAQLDAAARQNAQAPVSGQMLRVRGRVQRLLPDDHDDSPHQRFIIVSDDGRSLLVAHNLDLAPRLDGLKVGQSVLVYGQYEWNPEGGVLHWTHDDPAGQHEAGYIEWQGRRYQ
jgi:hypothetical protein